ncbi:hypothetical protein SKAU_G00143730 [Synaphobranchus kaupii]|uniref:Uncharacterized protein n=1 Tax=Synaphobranchus kaupii TaxID=118154 RepID=A0A9Q1FSW2_SYNKA|nr:hypothetical protein SKAU_G00143730 [Synaphobranchus kaupii]
MSPAVGLRSPPTPRAIALPEWLSGTSLPSSLLPCPLPPAPRPRSEAPRLFSCPFRGFSPTAVNNSKVQPGQSAHAKLTTVRAPLPLR